ncbi:hypothetical protein [Cupriavidus necator]|uniref:hypothetical protein n=1 Tax=Cupriavidus necator TaxID=106590 RepID=UPI001F2B0E47|nr:hypothetical protein [Cupriavidus necator]
MGYRRGFGDRRHRCDPTWASAEKGSKMLDALVGLVADSIRQLDETGWRYDLRQ